MKANVEDKIYVGKIVLIYSSNFLEWPQLIPYFQFLKKKFKYSNANPLTGLPCDVKFAS